MNGIEDQLTNAAEEARRQVTHVDTRSPATVRARLHRHRTVVGAAIAAGVFGLLGATAIIANNDGGATGFAASPSTATTDATASTTTADGAEPVATTAAPDEAVVYESDGSDGSTTDTTMSALIGSSPGELPDDYWADVHGGNAIVILDEPEYGFAFVPDPTATEGWWIALATALALRSIVYMPEAELEAPMSLPSLALGFIVSESGDEVTVVGIAPTGTESVTVALNGIDNLQIGETATHPEVDRASFSMVVPASRFEGLKTGTPLMAPRDAQGSPITTWTSGYMVATASINEYLGPLRALFTVEQPLVAESIEVDTLPDVLACDLAPEPIRGDRITNVQGFPTPIEAAEAFLAFLDYDGPAPSDHGYTEMLTPDGAVHYGIPIPDGSSMDDGVVTLITVIPVDGSDTQFESWTVSEWQASGC
jgi:hypothetical protein